MSEMLTTVPPSGGAPKISKINEAVIRIAGNSQDGIQAIGGFLARLAGRSEQEVMTFMTIPSTISGGPSIFQVRIGSGEVLSAGDEADMLLCFYQHSYEDHIKSLKLGGIVLYDADHVQPKPEWEESYRHVGVNISSLTVEAVGGTGKDKGKNIFAMGLLAKIFDLNVTKLTKLIEERFGGKDPTVVQNALTCFNGGYNHSLENLLKTYQFYTPDKKDRHQVVMNGNEALALGLIAAGVRFGAGYPITPWSDIMESLRRELPKYGGTFVQTEDEIAAISMALGASYAGRVAVTGSSGPGISLKTEALGWAVMSEMPLIIVDVQRGGPSTGMPTNVEQSDLNIACFGGHGDSPRVVIAPTSVEDCFYTAIEAVNIARKYSTPVFILTDQGIATRIEPRKSLPGHLARFHAGCRPQALRFVQARRHHTAPRAGHENFERQISHRHRPRTRRTRPSDRLAEIAPADDRQAPQQTPQTRVGISEIKNLWSGRRPDSARRLGFKPGADPRSR
jgi:2-oxoglutarate ferredoxin oxidoreductase subunit alpha